MTNLCEGIGHKKTNLYTIRYEIIKKIEIYLLI